MRATTLVICIAALIGISAANEPKRYAVWGAAGVVYGKAVRGNATGNLVYRAIPEDLAKSFGPMCYRAAEKHLKLRLCGAFLPHSSPTDSKHPNVNFVIWKIHLPSDPDELPPNQKSTFGEHDAIPGYTIIPKKP